METSGYRERRRQHRLGRRRLITGIALGSASLLASVVTGCVRGEKAPPPRAPEASPAARQPKQGGTLQYLTFVTGVFQAGLDPHTLQATEAGRQRLFYQGLLRPNLRTLDPEPELAQKLESPSPTEYILTLQPNVKWHNKPPATGRPLTVDDVVFSLNRMRSNEPRFILRANYSSVDKVEAVDKSTVKITLRVPDVSVLHTLAAPPSMILAPEVVEAAGDRFETAAKVVGTGPFVLVSKDDTSASVVRNNDYYKPGLPYLDGVRLHFLGDPLTRWAAFLAGRVDYAYVPGDVAKKFSAQQGSFLVEERYPAAWFNENGMLGLYTNVQKEPFRDARVYRALRLLVDHHEHVETQAKASFGRGRLISALPTALEAWDFTEEEYVSKFLPYKRPKDEAIRAALALLSAAGFTRDNSLSFTILTLSTAGNVYGPLAEAHFRQLGQGVIRGELRLLDQAQLNSLLQRGDFDVAASGMPSPVLDPGAYIRTNFHSNGGRNYGRWSDAKVNQMLDRERGIFNGQERKVAIKEILAYLIENAPYTGFAGWYQLNAVQPKVQDWVPEGLQWAMSHQFEQVWLEA